MKSSSHPPRRFAKRNPEQLSATELPYSGRSSCISPDPRRVCGLEKLSNML